MRGEKAVTDAETQRARYLSELFGLPGRVAIVTGGGAGIGRSVSLALGASGVLVVVGEKRLRSARETVRLLEAQGGRGTAVEADVTDPAAVSAMVKLSVETYQRVDILVNNAGVNMLKAAEELSVEEWREVLDVNLTGVFLCSQAAARVMIPRRSGAIVNVASIYGEVGNPLRDTVAYAASKGGVVNMTRALALEWAKYGVRVNAIAPGYTRTDLTRDQLEDPGFRSKVCELTPLGRVGVPEDLVGGVLYLASPAASMVTGHILHIDGGWLAR